MRIGRAGEVDSGARVFTASIGASGFRLDIEAHGPAGQFAQLAADRNTDIHTTLFGTCRATLESTGQTFLAERTCLLEVKNLIAN